MLEFLTSQTGPLDYEHIFLSPNIILSASRKDGDVVSLEPDPDSTSVSHSSC